jgi:hypothetical protein
MHHPTDSIYYVDSLLPGLKSNKLITTFCFGVFDRQIYLAVSYPLAFDEFNRSGTKDP